MTAKKSAKQPPAEAGASPDELADAWRVWLSLRWGFDILGELDAKADSIPATAGARTEYFRYRDGLLQALEAHDDARAELYLPLMWRTVQAALGKPFAAAGIAVIEGRKKPKRPEVQAWIEGDLSRHPGDTAAQRWNRAPDWITDDIGPDRFTKRVTAARKKAGIGRK